MTLLGTRQRNLLRLLGERGGTLTIFDPGAITTAKELHDRGLVAMLPASGSRRTHRGGESRWNVSLTERGRAIE